MKNAHVTAIWFLAFSALPLSFLPNFDECFQNSTEKRERFFTFILENTARFIVLFQKTSNIHSYNTRSSTSGKFYVTCKSSRLEIQNNSFSRLGVKLGNKIPRYITNLSKKALEMEHDYWNSPDYQKSRHIDTLAKGFNICFSCLYAFISIQFNLFPLDVVP